MTLLLTSFAPWKAHQSTNASDDLIALLSARQQLPPNTRLIRHLPVHVQLVRSVSGYSPLATIYGRVLWNG